MPTLVRIPFGNERTDSIIAMGTSSPRNAPTIPPVQNNGLIKYYFDHSIPAEQNGTTLRVRVKSSSPILQAAFNGQQLSVRISSDAFETDPYIIDEGADPMLSMRLRPNKWRGS